jgi:hypothetical protein
MNAPVAARGKIRIRRPNVSPPPVEGAPAFTLNRPLKGAKIGFRDDLAWRSWTLIVKDWSERLREAGAEPVVLVTKQRTGEEGEKTRADIDLWASQVDCAVVGLGN